MIFSYLLNMQSHPSWVCGLKQQNEWSLNKLMQVTPFVGVWIETYMYPFGYALRMSHPSWVCGLKLLVVTLVVVVLLSHPSWVCGLKPILWYDDIRKYMSHPSWVCGLKQPYQ